MFPFGCLGALRPPESFLFPLRFGIPKPYSLGFLFPQIVVLCGKKKLRNNQMDFLAELGEFKKDFNEIKQVLYNDC